MMLPHLSRRLNLILNESDWRPPNMEALACSSHSAVMSSVSALGFKANASASEGRS